MKKKGNVIDNKIKNTRIHIKIKKRIYTQKKKKKGGEQKSQTRIIIREKGRRGIQY